MTSPTSAPAAPPPASVMMGGLLMVLATVCFVCLDATLKMLVRSHDVLFLSWGRYLFQVLYLLVLIPK